MATNLRPTAIAAKGISSVVSRRSTSSSLALARTRAALTAASRICSSCPAVRGFWGMSFSLHHQDVGESERSMLHVPVFLFRHFEHGLGKWILRPFSFSLYQRPEGFTVRLVQALGSFNHACSCGELIHNSSCLFGCCFFRLGFVILLPLWVRNPP